MQETRTRLVREGDQLQEIIREAIAEFKKEKTQEKLERARKALAEIRERLNSQSWQPVSADISEIAQAGFNLGSQVALKGLNKYK